VRNVGVDIVKSIAIMCVVGVHFFLNTKFYTVDLDNLNLFIQTIFQQIFLVCIPLFLISTGYLNNNIDVSKKYFKKIIPIIIIYILYSVPALIYRAYINEIESDILTWISLIFKFKGNRYAWYIDLYIGLFLLMPFLNRMYTTLDDKEKKILLVVLIFMTSLIPLINGKFGFLALPSYWSSIYPLTYFFLGKYLKDFNPNIKLFKNILYLVLIILIQALIEYISADNGKYIHYLTDYTSLFRLIEGYLAFSLLSRFNIKNKFIRGQITNISSLTLDIYLASFLTDRIVYKEILKNCSVTQEKWLIMIIPAVFISFTLAYIIANIRKKLIKVR
jgi:surface polysaccharide O-acyltransferase-like enzyme